MLLRVCDAGELYRASVFYLNRFILLNINIESFIGKS